MFDYYFQKAGGTWNQWEDLIERGNTISPNAKVSYINTVIMYSLNIIMYFSNYVFQ